MVPITYITCRLSGWLYFAVCNADIWFCGVSLYLAFCMRLCFYVSVRRIVAESLSSPDLFICWLLSLQLPHHAPPLFLYCLSPWQLIWWFLPLPDCLLSPSFPLPALFILSLPQTQATLYDCLASTPPPTPQPNSTEPAVVSNQNNIFKNSTKHYPYKQRGPPCWLFMYSGVHCIMVEMHSGAQHGNFPSKFDVFIHSR